MTINICYPYQLFFVLLFITHHVQAQENTFTYTVRLLDAVSLKPIAGAHILGPRQQSTSSEDGHFQIQVESVTTLKITHVSYESKMVETGVGNSGLTTITLFPVTLDLDIVTVRPMPE